MFDDDVLTEAVLSQFDGKSRTLKIDTAKAKILTGYSEGEIRAAGNAVKDLIVSRGRLPHTSDVAKAIYKHRQAILSIA